MAQQHFTIEQANALLPWLREALAEAHKLRDQIVAAMTAARELSVKARSNGGGTVDRQLADSENDLTRLNDAIQKRLEDVQRKGILVRDVDRGLVDFPSLRDGREVHLCWILGEDAVGFWHGTDTGYSGRKPL